MQSVVITGTSTGIGHAAAKILIDRGYRVFGNVRSAADAERLSAELGADFTPLIFDVTDGPAIREAADQVAAALGPETLAGLVNNAGIAVSGALLDVSIPDLRRQLEVNVIGQMAVTQAFAPLLGTDPARVGQPGRIIMVSSVAGRSALPFNGPYSASKFALEGLSESLRRELMLFGIDVIVVAPGMIATPIWDKAGSADTAQFAGSPFRPIYETSRKRVLDLARKGLRPERVGEVIAQALTASRPKTRYVVAPRSLQQFARTHLPARIVDRLIAAWLGLAPKTPPK